MKTLLQLTIICLGLLVPSIQAQNNAPVPVVITPTQVQYKVIDLAQLSLPINTSQATALESLLNELGAQGWRLVTATGTLIILTRAG